MSWMLNAQPCRQREIHCSRWFQFLDLIWHSYGAHSAVGVHWLYPLSQVHKNIFFLLFRAYVTPHISRNHNQGVLLWPPPREALAKNPQESNHRCNSFIHKWSEITRKKISFVCCYLSKTQSEPPGKHPDNKIKMCTRGVMHSAHINS